MNRGIMVTRDDPDQDELAFSARFLFNFLSMAHVIAFAYQTRAYFLNTSYADSIAMYVYACLFIPRVLN